MKRTINSIGAATLALVAVLALAGCPVVEYGAPGWPMIEPQDVYTAYERLEVSSPGLDRPLKSAADYERFRGQEATLVLREKLNDTRKVRGMIGGIDGADALVETPGGTVRVPLDNIERARLVPKIEWRKDR